MPKKIRRGRRGGENRPSKLKYLLDYFDLPYLDSQTLDQYEERAVQLNILSDEYIQSRNTDYTGFGLKVISY